MNESPVSNVSDTARWVAVYRAWESARPDALFKDPYAELLAGERGRAISALMPVSARNGWPIIARTKLIDDLVQRALGQACDRVVNLAAGLDTRPYRLHLPESLVWVEADLPALIEEKERALADAKPRCELRRIKVDLTIAPALRAALRDALGDAQRALVIAEGLLLYLAEPEVRELALDLLAAPGVHSWVVDLASPAILAMMRKEMGAHLANAPLQFAPADGVGYFESLGWRTASAQSILHAAGRMRRLPWLLGLIGRLPEANPRKLKHARWSGVVQLDRS
jgi:methyltransferase (TIGR00027 family)